MNSIRQYIIANKEKSETLISRAEIFGLALTMIAVVLMIKKMAFSSQFFIMGLSALAFVYAFLGAFCKEIFSLKENDLFSKALFASYLSLSVTTMGILFMVMRWPGAQVMLETGCVATGVFFIFFLYHLYFGDTEESKKTIINNLVVRMLPTLVAVGILIALYLKT